MSIEKDNPMLKEYLADAYDWLTESPAEIRSVNHVDASEKMKASLLRCFKMMPIKDKVNFLSSAMSLDYDLSKAALRESMRSIDWFNHLHDADDRTLFKNVAKSLMEIAEGQS